MNQPIVSSTKGRACAARPLACLPLFLMVVLAVMASPAAAAQPKAPGLTGTDPPSPSTETRPSVLGDADGVITSGVGALRTARLGPVTRAQHPNFLITVYANDPTCKSEAAIVGQGTAAALESSGVALTVDLPEDVETALYATETDPGSPGEPSPCSNGIFYQQVATAPEPPNFTAIVPAPPANDNTPALTGTAAPHSTVTIYTNPGCTGSPVASGTSFQFGGAGIQVPVSDNSTTTFYATDTLATLISSCSTSSISYQEVTPESPPAEEPPAGGGGGGNGGGGDERPREHLPNPPGKPASPKLRTTPEGIANDNTPTVTGKAPGAVRVQVFDGAGCRGDAVAAGSVAQFSAGLPVRVPDNSIDSLYGISIDGGGDRSPCTPDPVVYVEDSTAPHVRFTSGPGPKTHKRTVHFTFFDTTADLSTTFQCRLDRHPWTPCASPLRLRRLGRRRHTLAVRGIDAAGNVEQAGTKRRFKVTGHR